MSKNISVHRDSYCRIPVIDNVPTSRVWSPFLCPEEPVNSGFAKVVAIISKSRSEGGDFHRPFSKSRRGDFAFLSKKRSLFGKLDLNCTLLPYPLWQSRNTGMIEMWSRCDGYGNGVGILRLSFPKILHFWTFQYLIWRFSIWSEKVSNPPS